MKRVFSALAVIAIVSSALAFAPAKKGGSFCVSSSAPNVACFVINGKTEINNNKPSNTYYKFLGWNGTAANCTTTCDTQVTLYNEQ